MLLTAGERISMALLAMAIREAGMEAISFTGVAGGHHHGRPPHGRADRGGPGGPGPAGAGSPARRDRGGVPGREPEPGGDHAGPGRLGHDGRGPRGRAGRGAVRHLHGRGRRFHGRSAEGAHGAADPHGRVRRDARAGGGRAPRWCIPGPSRSPPATTWSSGSCPRCWRARTAARSSHGGRRPWKTRPHRRGLGGPVRPARAAGPAGGDEQHDAGPVAADGGGRERGPAHPDGPRRRRRSIQLTVARRSCAEAEAVCSGGGGGAGRRGGGCDPGPGPGHPGGERHAQAPRRVRPGLRDAAGRGRGRVQRVRHLRLHHPDGGRRGRGPGGPPPPRRLRPRGGRREGGRPGRHGRGGPDHAPRPGGAAAGGGGGRAPGLRRSAGGTVQWRGREWRLVAVPSPGRSAAATSPCSPRARPEPGMGAAWRRRRARWWWTTRRRGGWTRTCRSWSRR
jgi:hypothetical protein